MLWGFSARADAPPVTFEAIPKRGGVRLLARLSGSLASEYRDAVAATVEHVEACLPNGVVAERSTLVRSGDAARIVARDVRAARAGARDLACALAAARPGPVILADVRSCYAAIAPDVVERRLRRLGCEDAAVRTRALLERLGEAGVAGLPVGPRASAVLANAVLAEVDEAIAGEGALHLRWVDDLAIFAGDRDPERVLRRVAEALHALGLSLAEEKCAIGEISATRFGRSLGRPALPRLGGSLG